jgi:signal peptidase I
MLVIHDPLPWRTPLPAGSDQVPVNQTRKAMMASEDEREDRRPAVTRATSPQLSDRSRDEPERPTAKDPRAAAADERANSAEPPEDEAASEAAPTTPRKKQTSFWKELPILIVVALVLTFLIQTFLARVYVIPSASMEQTLNGCPGCTGDRILVDKITYDFTDPEPGDVIVFKSPPGWDQGEFKVDESSNPVIQWLRQFGSAIGIGSPSEYDLVKRVIAVGGQTVSCCDARNRVLVDGKPLNEPYIYYDPAFGNSQQQFPPVKIP